MPLCFCDHPVRSQRSFVFLFTLHKARHLFCMSGAWSLSFQHTEILSNENIPPPDKHKTGWYWVLVIWNKAWPVAHGWPRCVELIAQSARGSWGGLFYSKMLIQREDSMNMQTPYDERASSNWSCRKNRKSIGQIFERTFIFNCHSPNFLFTWITTRSEARHKTWRNKWLFPNSRLPNYEVEEEWNTMLMLLENNQWQVSGMKPDPKQKWTTGNTFYLFTVTLNKHYVSACKGLLNVGLRFLVKWN